MSAFVGNQMTAAAVTGGGDPSSRMKIWPRLLKAAADGRAKAGSGFFLPLCQHTVPVRPSILRTGDLFGSERFKRFEVCSHPVRLEKAGELVRVDPNLSDGMASAPAVRSFLRVELEPFIIGGGQVTVQDTAEGVESRGEMKER